jgi:hypothetical protein
MSARKRSSVAAVEDEEAFPRGGGDALTPLERRKIAQEAQAAVERESLEPATKKARKSKAFTKAAKVRIAQWNLRISVVSCPVNNQVQVTLIY